MNVKYAHVFLGFLYISLLVTIIPQVVGFSENTFLNDYYSKRILAVVFLPILFIYLAQACTTLSLPTLHNKSISFLYFSGAIIFLLTGMYWLIAEKNTTVMNILSDLFIYISVAIYYYFSKQIESKQLIFFLKTSMVLAIFISVLSIKHQFSYLGVVSCTSFLFYIFYSKKDILFYSLLLPFALFGLLMSLVGKSAIVVMVITILVHSYILFGRTKLFVFLSVFGGCMFILASIPSIQNIIMETPAYKKAVVFNISTDIDESDLSTGHRLYEMVLVYNKFESASLYNKFIGFGFGAAIDVSGTNDSSVVVSNSDPTKVRFVHLLLGFIILKLGLAGGITYLAIFTLALKRNFRILLLCRNSNLSTKNKYIIGFSLSYLFSILWDGQISSGHLLANPLFWVLCFYPLATILQIEKANYET